MTRKAQGKPIIPTELEEVAKEFQN